MENETKQIIQDDNTQPAVPIKSNSAGEHPFSAYITNLGKYNEGELVGKWHPFPTTKQEIQEAFGEIGVDGKRYEEFFVTDYDCEIGFIYDKLPEYANLDELNYLATKLTELSEWELDVFEGALALDDNGSDIQAMINITENLDCYDYLSGIHDTYALGLYWVEESGCYDTNQLGTLCNYIDYESFGRDISYDELGAFVNGGYIRATGEGFTVVYDGMDIPEEYRVFTSPANQREKKRSVNDRER